MAWFLLGIILIAVAIFIAVYVYFDKKLQKVDAEFKAYGHEFTEEDSP